MRRIFAWLRARFAPAWARHLPEFAVKIARFAAALATAFLMGVAGLSAAQATPVSYEYALAGPGPNGTLNFTLSDDPSFGNNAANVTAFDINLDGIDFNLSNGTLMRLDFLGGYLVNIIYNDNLPNLTFGTLGLGYGYVNRQDRQDIHRAAGVIIGGRVANVPEPASLAMMLSGLLIAGAFATRRTRAKAAA